MLYSFSNFSSPAFSSSFLSTLPSSSRRLLYHSPAFDPFAPFTETFGFTGVDYPMSQVGSGAGAYLKAMGKSNTIAFYRNHFCLLNITPHTLNRMRKTRRRLFYVTHYCTLFRQGQYYTVELMWPVWVGKAPKGVLTQTMPGWHNPFLKDEWQEFHIAEFAFVNLRYLWPYDHSWQRLDINRSPLAPEEMKTWWKETFLPAVKIRSEDTFGYSIFRFSEGYHDAPSYIPPMAHEAEKHFAPETDRYKAAMGAVAAQASEVPEHYWWTPHDGATLPFIRKWEPLGLVVEPEMPVYMPLDSRLPDGHWMDPSQENVTQFLDKAIDPSSYVFRRAFPPLSETLADEIVDTFRNNDKYYETKPLGLDPLWAEPFRGPITLSPQEIAFRRSAARVPPTASAAFTEWISDLSNMRMLDTHIQQRIDTYITETLASPQWKHMTKQEVIEARAIAIDRERRAYGIDAELLDAPLPEDFEPEWSSDEEVGYSASWMKWGDVTEYNPHGPVSENMWSGMEADHMEDWIELLRNERGSINDTIDFGPFVDYEPTPEPDRDFATLENPDFRSDWRWARLRKYWADPLSITRQKTSKREADFSIWTDPRREE